MYCDERVLGFYGMAFVAAVQDGISLSRAADPCVLSSAYGVLTLPLSSLGSRLDDFGFFEVNLDNSFDPVFIYLSYGRAQEVDRSVVDLVDPLFPYCWNSAKVVDLPDKLVHEYKCTADGPFVHHNRRLPAFTILNRSAMSHLSCPDAARFALRALGNSALFWRLLRPSPS